MPRKKRKPLNNLIVISDLHCGCRLGLCPPEVQLDDAAIYKHTPLQADIWKRWEEFWNEWVPMVPRGECKGCYWHLRGTEAHVGPSGEEEERLAEELNAIPDREGRFARWELWLEIGVGLVHLTHHIGTAGSLAYETTAVHKELEQAFVEAARWGNRHPDVIVRSHRHRNVETRIQTAHGFATACTTAGWQGKTPFVFKIVGGRQTLPQIGGTLVRSGDEDVFTRHRLWNLNRPKTEKPYAK